MKVRYEVSMLIVFFVITVIILVFNQDYPQINLWVPIYFMIAVLLFFIGKYSGEINTRKRLEPLIEK